MNDANTLCAHFSAFFAPLCHPLCGMRLLTHSLPHYSMRLACLMRDALHDVCMFRSGRKYFVCAAAVFRSPGAISTKAGLFSATSHIHTHTHARYEMWKYALAAEWVAKKTLQKYVYLHDHDNSMVHGTFLVLDIFLASARPPNARPPTRNTNTLTFFSRNLWEPHEINAYDTIFVAITLCAPINRRMCP